LTIPTTPEPNKSHLGLIMRLLTGAGTPRAFHSLASAWLIAFLDPDGDLIVALFAVIGKQLAAIVVWLKPVPLN
jgi:hypothetical protein